MQSLCKLEETSDWNTVKDNVAQGLIGNTREKQASGSDGCSPPPGRGVFGNGLPEAE